MRLSQSTRVLCARVLCTRVLCTRVLLYQSDLGTLMQPINNLESAAHAKRTGSQSALEYAARHMADCVFLYCALFSWLCNVFPDESQWKSTETVVDTGVTPSF